ncbi:MAG: type I secretion system permease/ATPase [Rickettsiales bacterium]
MKDNSIDLNILQQSLNLCKRAFIYNFIFSFFINILMLVSSIYSLQILDRVLSSSSLETLLMLSIITIIVYIILALLQIIRSFVFLHISNWLDNKLSIPLVETSISYGHKNQGSQNLRDLATIKSMITGQTITHLFDAPWAIIYLLVIFFIHWINGIIVLIGAIILLILALINEKITKKQLEKANEINILSLQNIEAISRNSEIIKAMGMKKNIVTSWQEINNKHLQANHIVSVRTSLITNITKSIRLLIQMATMAVGAILVLKNHMSAGGIIATSILSGKALAPFDAAMHIYKTLINSKKSYQRLTKSLEYYKLDEDKIELPEPQGALFLDNLIYKLPKSDKFIIKAANLKIGSGEIIGLIGPSGAGKTSLVRLIVGVLKPTKGSVRLDNADIAQQDNEKIGKYIGYLPQDIELFNATIKENIARMSKEEEAEKIIEAAKFTHIHDLILQLEQGYETNALNLSAGQKQRIALARAFLNLPKLVILDEPNSNLDSAGEEALLKTIINAKKAKITTIIISHKPSILNFVDKIIFLVNGEVKAFDEKQKVIDMISNKTK